MTQHLDAHNTSKVWRLEQPQNRLKVAVVGCGVGRAHALAYQALPDYFEILSICDLDTKKAQALALEVGALGFTADYTALLENPDLDMVDICTPPHLHVPMIIEAIQAGKHAICEKPIAASLADVDKLIALEKGSPKRIMPIFQYRFGNGLQKLEYLQKLGLLGTAHVGVLVK